MSILNLLRSKREEKASDVQDLARRVANGETVDPDRILQAVSAAGMDDEGFCELVELIERRNKIRERADREANAEREKAAVEKELAAINEAWKASNNKFEEQHAPVAARLEAVNSRLADARSARESLRQDNNLPSGLRDARRAAEKRHREALFAKDAPQKRLAEHEYLVKHAKAHRDTPLEATLPMTEFQIKQTLEEAAAMSAHLRRELEAAQAKCDEAKAALAAIDKQCRDF
jgi:chromosome segregation ATPase